MYHFYLHFINAEMKSELYYETREHIIKKLKSHVKYLKFWPKNNRNL